MTGTSAGTGVVRGATEVVRAAGVWPMTGDGALRAPVPRARRCGAAGAGAGASARAAGGRGAVPAGCLGGGRGGRRARCAAAVGRAAARRRGRLLGRRLAGSARGPATRYWSTESGSARYFSYISSTSHSLAPYSPDVVSSDPDSGQLARHSRSPTLSVDAGLPLPAIGRARTRWCTGSPRTSLNPSRERPGTLRGGSVEAMEFYRTTPEPRPHLLRRVPRPEPVGRHQPPRRLARARRRFGGDPCRSSRRT